MASGEMRLRASVNRSSKGTPLSSIARSSKCIQGISQNWRRAGPNSAMAQPCFRPKRLSERAYHDPRRRPSPDRARILARSLIQEQHKRQALSGKDDQQ